MKIFIGIDAVEVKRFQHFHTYSRKQLSRLFSTDEIAYCLQNPIKSAERFAARFAAKEALYKALTHALEKPPCSFLQLCAVTSIINKPHPVATIKWEQLGTPQKQLQISITHTKDLAFAHVMLYKEE